MPRCSQIKYKMKISYVVEASYTWQKYDTITHTHAVNTCFLYDVNYNNVHIRNSQLSTLISFL